MPEYELKTRLQDTDGSLFGYTVLRTGEPDTAKQMYPLEILVMLANAHLEGDSFFCYSKDRRKKARITAKQTGPALDVDFYLTTTPNDDPDTNLENLPVAQWTGTGR